MKFTIDRKTWIRGTGPRESYLLRDEDQKRCCVGQMCQQIGFEDKYILGIKAVSQLKDRIPQDWLDKLMEANFIKRTMLPPEPAAFIGLAEAAWLNDAYEINDETFSTDEERERRLTSLLAAHGHQLVFTD